MIKISMYIYNVGQIRLDYQPLFLEMSPCSASGQERAGEIEPRVRSGHPVKIAFRNANGSITLSLCLL